MRGIVWIGAFLALGSACVDKGPGGSGKQIDPAYIEQNLLTTPPGRLDNQVGANLGDKVVYLGNEVDSTQLAPGGSARVVHYWQVLQPPGKDWRIFAHVKGPTAGDWMNVDATDMRIGYPAAKWKAGDIIRDEQKFTLGKDWKSAHADLVVGLYPRGRHEPEARMPVISGGDGLVQPDGTLRVVRFLVDRTAAPTPAGDASGDYVVRKVSEPITVDGKADEAAWAGAPWSPLFTDAEGSPSVGHDTRAKLLYDDQHLYVFIQVKDDDVHSPFTERDGTLWKADVVELFIDADRNRRGYVELQVNPNNTQLDYWFAHTRAQPSDPSFDAKMRSAVVVHGTTDNRNDKDTGWDVEIAIPLEAVKGGHAAMAINLPPEVGDRWNLNIVRAEQPKKGNIAASSWNQISYSDWHGLDRMATVVFGDGDGKTQVANRGAAPAEGEPGAPADEAAAPADPAAAARPGSAPSSAATERQRPPVPRELKVAPMPTSAGGGN